MLIYILGPIILLTSSAAAQQKDACEDIDQTTEAVICISTPHPMLTVNRTDGQVQIYVTLKASRGVSKPKKVRVDVSAAANASGVNLGEGENAVSTNVIIPASGEIKDLPVFRVVTKKDNQQSGRLYYSIFCEPSDRSIKVIGIPLNVEVWTNP